MDVREDLKAYLDGEISPERAEEVRKAIERDPELQQEVQFMNILTGHIKSASSSPSPSGLEATVGKLKPSLSRRRTARIMQLGLAAACVVALGFVLIPIFAQSKSSAKSTRADLSAGASVPMDGFAKAPAELDWERRGGGGADSAKAKTESRPSLDEEAGEVTSAAPSTAPSFPIDRPVIRTADLGLLVPDVLKAVAAATSIAQGMGGYVESSSASHDRSADASAALTMRVPQSRFDRTLDSLRALGEVRSESANGVDVSGQIIDLEARIRVLRQEEAQYLEILKHTRKIGEVLNLRDRISSVRQEIESMQGQLKATKSQAAMSTISLSLQERPKVVGSKEEGGWASDSYASAVNGLKAAGRFFGQAAIGLFVYAPIWVPVLAIGLLAYRKAFPKA